MAASVIVAALGFWIAWKTYGRGRGLEGGATWASRHAVLHRLLVNKYWVDELYDHWIVRPLRRLAEGLKRFVDGYIIDGVLVHGTAFFAEITGDLLRFTTTGNLRNYALYFLLGLIIIFGLMI